MKQAQFQFSLQKDSILHMNSADNSLPEQTNPRNRHIDALKGAAILLVVLGHSIQVHDVNFDQNILFRVIYSFHMFLFMFLSGFVLPSQLNLSILSYLKKNSCRLALPFITWHLINYAVTGFTHPVPEFIPYLFALFKSPDLGLWFLWVLFINSSLLFLVVKTLRIRKMVRWEGYIILAAILLSRSFSSDLLGLSLVKQYFLYYAAGYLARQYMDIIRKHRTALQISSLITFPFLALFWRRNEFPTFYNNLMQWMNEPHLVRFLVSIYKYAVSFSGIILTWVIIEKVRALRLYDVFCRLGVMTLDIYAMHGYFLIGLGVGIAKYTSSAIVALALSLSLSIFLLRQNRWLKLFFLGQTGR
jgi:fucose 4-O-acetylase-like acetyltransferase